MKILRLNFALSIVFAVAMSLVFIKDATMWWIPIASFFGMLIVLYFAVWIVLWLISKTAVKKKYEKPSKFYSHTFNVGYDYLYSSARAIPKCSGIEKIPTDRKFLIVSNHRSNFDNMVQSYYLRSFFVAYISKPSNFKIPVGHGFMKRCLYLAIDRENPLKSLRTINEATKLVKNDVTSIAVFPEGTRSKAKEMNEFKTGYLRIAYKTGCPIVVSSITGTQDIHKNFPFHRTVVRYDILDVINAEEYMSLKEEELSDKIRTIIETDLIKKGEIKK